MNIQIKYWYRLFESTVMVLAFIVKPYFVDSKRYFFTNLGSWDFVELFGKLILIFYFIVSLLYFILNGKENMSVPELIKYYKEKNKKK